MSATIDETDRIKTNGRSLTARRPHFGRVRALYEEAIREYGGGDITAEDMAAIRQAIRLQLEEEKSLRVKGAIIFLVIASIAGGVAFMFTFR